MVAPAGSCREPPWGRGWDAGPSCWAAPLTPGLRVRVAATGLCPASGGRGLRGGGPAPAHHCASLPGLLVVGGEPGARLLHSCRAQVGGVAGERQGSADLHGRQGGWSPPCPAA